ncbi:MAG: hypothetical protein GC206_13330 [Alphaproteobacteria bacterium]|nr:hypothetical protein [Alphaproteobacteria bacterium]
MTTFWLGWRERVLRERWGKEDACAIAKRLGCTRNAVIGKANRLALKPIATATARRWARIRRAAVERAKHGRAL